MGDTDRVRLEIRISRELKDRFSALCENQGFTISAKLKSMIMAELLADLSRLENKPVKKVTVKKSLPIQNKLSSEQSMLSDNHSETIQATTIPEKVKTSENAVKTQNLSDDFNDMFFSSNAFGVSNHNDLLQSALNSSKNRKISKKKRK